VTPPLLQKAMPAFSVLHQPPGTQPPPLPSPPGNAASVLLPMHLFLSERQFLSQIPALARYLSPTSCHITGRDGHSSWVILRHREASRKPIQPTWRPQQAWVHHKLSLFSLHSKLDICLKSPTRLTLSLFLFDYYGILKMSNCGTKLGTNYALQRTAATSRFVESFLPRDSSVQNPS